MLKIRGTEIQQALTELMMQAAGPRWLQPFKAHWRGTGDRVRQPSVARSVHRATANYRKTSIYAGSNEIQRNIIAKMTLGL